MNMATVVAPWISHGIAEMGVFCATCLYTEQHDQLYTRAEFVEHLKICRVQPFDDYLMFIRKALNREFRRLSFHHGDNWKDMGS
jgi:hypothetical protein